MLNKYTIPCLIFPLLLLIIGCGAELNTSSGYKSSSIITQVPIPNSAKQIELIGNFSNPNIKVGVKYELKDIGGEQGLFPPSQYFQKLNELNWIELEDKRMGHIHFFQKNDKMIAIEIRQDTFTIYEMRNTTIS